MNRRSFLQSGAIGLVAAAAGCQGPSPRSTAARITIIDCHTHFFDPMRPGGVPWPGRNDAFLYRTTLPVHYKGEKVPAPVTGTVVVEASSWVEDNQWVLDLARDEPFIVGLCGNLDPAGSDFERHFERFRTNPLYRGIRVSGAGLNSAVGDAAWVRRVGRLAEGDLQLDVNVGVESLASVARLAGALPHLRIVIDHLANTAIDGRQPAADWQRGMEAAARHPNVFAKVSGLVEGASRFAKPSPTDAAYYAPWLDTLWNVFGPQRLIYGSNWPVSALFAPLYDVQRLVADYFASRGATASAQVFAENARVAYRWLTR